jgi:hypothetical protein
MASSGIALRPSRSVIAMITVVAAGALSIGVFFTNRHEGLPSTRYFATSGLGIRVERAITALAPPGVNIQSIRCAANSPSAMTCLAHFTGSYGPGIYTRAVATNPKTGQFSLNKWARIKFTNNRLLRKGIQHVKTVPRARQPAS